MAKNARVAVDIAAVDQFSATLAKARRDLVATGDAAKLMDSKMGGLSLPSLSFSQAGKELGAFHAQATRQIGSLARMTPGLGATAGIGSIAGLGEIVTRYAGLGVELRNVSRVAGTTSAGMDSRRGAARLMGVSASTADQAMVGLNKTLADAFYGKNADAAAAFRQAGIGLQGMAGGAAKAEDKLPAIADFMQRLMKSDPRAAVTFADKIGVGPEAINLLGIGAERLAALRKEAAALSGVTDDGQDSAEKFAASMGRVGISADRVGRTITTTLEPVVGPMLDQFANWTRDHAQEVQDGFKGIATGIGAAALAIPPAISRLRDYGAEVSSVFDAIKRAGESVGADKLAVWLKDNVSRSSSIIDRNGFDQSVFDGLSPAERERYQGSSLERGRFNQQVNPGRYGGAGGGGAGGGGSPSTSTNSADKSAFIAKWGPEAQRIAGELQTSPENVLAHWGQETGWGKHEHDNNVGNLQALPGTPGTVIRGDTHKDGSAYQAPFFAYKTPAEAADAYKSWILRKGAPVQGTANDPVAFGNALRSKGYMENPNAPQDIARERRGLVIPAPAKPEEPDLTRGGRVPQALAPSAAPTTGGGTNRMEVHLIGDNLPPGITPRVNMQGDGAELSTVRLRYAMPPGG